MALKKVCDVEIRRDASVAKETTSYFQASDPWNMFLDGMHCIVCIEDIEDLECPDTLTATKNRYRVSMEFAMLDLPEGGRGSIFKHLGHSEEINTHVYQAPLAI